MSGEAVAGGAAGDAGRRGGVAASLGVADWLGFAATPSFALIALLTAVQGDPAHMLCSGTHGASPLGGMLPMYALMSVFHAAPWLKLIARRRADRKA